MGLHRTCGEPNETELTAPHCLLYRSFPGRVQAPDEPDGGTGVEFDRDKLAPYAVKL